LWLANCSLGSLEDRRSHGDRSARVRNVDGWCARGETFGHSEMHHQSSFNRIVLGPRGADASTFGFGLIREATHA
jgi:hypothetical protein